MHIYISKTLRNVEWWSVRIKYCKKMLLNIALIPSYPTIPYYTTTTIQQRFMNIDEMEMEMAIFKFFFSFVCRCTKEIVATV